jgi:FixJ family two-component response regulator
VDDEEFIRGSFKLYFESMGYLVSVADGGDSALVAFGQKSEPVDVVLLDLVMPGTSGIDVLRRFKELNDDVEVIIATGCGSMHSAVEALRYGAYDYITKPILNFDEDLLRVVEEALAERRERLTKKRRLEDVARSGQALPPGEVAAFYKELESVAKEAFSSRTRGESALTIALFLEQFAGVAAAAVLERPGDGSLCSFARWGVFAEDRRADALLAPGSQWLRSLETKTSWARLPPEDPALDLLGPGGSVEFLRVQVPCFPGTNGGGRDVILLRRAGDKTLSQAPDVGLLALVMASSAAPPEGAEG